MSTKPKYTPEEIEHRKKYLAKCFEACDLVCYRLCCVAHVECLVDRDIKQDGNGASVEAARFLTWAQV
jgi:hypothetical protein